MASINFLRFAIALVCSCTVYLKENSTAIGLPFIGHPSVSLRRVVRGAMPKRRRTARTGTYTRETRRASGTRASRNSSMASTRVHARKRACGGAQEGVDGRSA